LAGQTRRFWQPIVQRATGYQDSRIEVVIARSVRRLSNPFFPSRTGMELLRGACSSGAPSSRGPRPGLRNDEQLRAFAHSSIFCRIAASFRLIPDADQDSVFDPGAGCRRSWRSFSVAGRDVVLRDATPQSRQGSACIRAINIGACQDLLAAAQPNSWGVVLQIRKASALKPRGMKCISRRPSIHHEEAATVSIGWVQL